MICNWLPQTKYQTVTHNRKLNAYICFVCFAYKWPFVMCKMHMRKWESCYTIGRWIFIILMCILRRLAWRGKTVLWPAAIKRNLQVAMVYGGLCAFHNLWCRGELLFFPRHWMWSTSVYLCHRINLLTGTQSNTLFISHSFQ